ncbi:uncharacterized protein MSANTD5 [Microtus pennsylvanicus]|uniref:uncharacterized protein MSANTD5 n=1 Tax=Microtus pennsylvanicus TaxID=10058 RepID=UPI003F6BFA58
MEPDQVERLRNTEELNVEQSGKQEGQRPSGPSCHPWTDSEIRIFLEEWEVVERRVGNPGRKISETIQALCLQLNERRGLKKSWESCVDLLLTLQNLHRSLCSERPGAVPLFSPYSEALYRILGRPPGTHYLPPSLAGSSCSPWTDSEIRIFLREWEGVEWRVGNPCRKILEKSWAIHQQINVRRGLKKSWASCVDLLLTLQNLHRILCNERLEAIPLFSPYSKALYRILGRPPAGSHTVPWPLESSLGHITMTVFPSPLSPVHQLWDFGIPIPSAELQENPSPMMSREDSLLPR